MTVVLVGLGIVVALVAIDAIGRLDERRRPKPRDPPGTDKIVVDLTGRDPE